MYDDSGKIPFSPLTLIIIFIIAILVIMGVTVALNGGTSTPVIEENNSSSDNITKENQTTYVTAMIGNNSYGQVTKLTGLGNSSSDVRIALICGVDQSGNSSNAVVPTVENDKNLSYAYDIYLVKTTSSNLAEDNENTMNNLTENEMSEQLAAEYVVPDIISNNYNLTVDIHSTSDSNPYVFVPVDTTYTSEKIVEAISNQGSVGRYTPDQHKFTESISEPIISYEIPSFVYVSREYHQNSTSNEISNVLQVIDNFDFKKLFDNTDNTNDATNTSYTDTVSSNQSSSNNNYSSNSSQYYTGTNEVEGY